MRDSDILQVWSRLLRCAASAGTAIALILCTTANAQDRWVIASTAGTCLAVTAAGQEFGPQPCPRLAYVSMAGRDSTIALRLANDQVSLKIEGRRVSAAGQEFVSQMSTVTMIGSGPQVEAQGSGTCTATVSDDERYLKRLSCSGTWQGKPFSLSFAGTGPYAPPPPPDTKAPVPAPSATPANPPAAEPGREPPPEWFRWFILLLGLGGSLLLWGQSYAATRRWSSRPTTTGTVVSAELLSREMRLTPDSVFGQVHHTPVVHYEYAVGGKRYDSSRVMALEWLNPDIGMARAGIDHVVEKDARAVLDRYPVGSQVRVFYNPSDPSDVVLEYGDPNAIYRWSTIAVFILGALAMFVYVSRQ